jgi:uncharacterized protein involved in exopolysaccharide biosynthesis
MTQAGTSAPSPVSSLAAQFGVNVSGSSDAAQSPEFYSEILRSRTLQDKIYGGQTPNARRIRRAVKGVEIVASPKTTIMTVSVRARSSELATHIAANVLTQLDEFNRDRRHARMQAERQFAEERFADARGQLRMAETSLQSFLEQNRDYRNSPDLQMRAERYERDVIFRQQLYTSLAQAYEQAKIDEVRQMPVLTVIDPPDTPTVPDPRGLLKRGVIAALLGVLVAALFALANEARRAGRDIRLGTDS